MGGCDMEYLGTKEPYYFHAGVVDEEEIFHMAHLNAGYG